MHHEHHKHHHLLNYTLYYSVTTALVICIIKIYSWKSTGSVSMLATLIDSMLDIAASLINLLAMRYALMPADNEHRFGHNKIEDLAVFGQSIFFMTSGLYTAYTAVAHLVNPAPVTNSHTGIYAMIACMILTILLIFCQSYTLHKTDSKVIEADKLHYVTDLFTNAVALLSLFLSQSWLFLDALFGLAIAAYITHASYGLFTKAIKNLIDEEFNNEERKRILAIIKNIDGVLGVHDIKTRYAGNKPFIQLHLELNGSQSLLSAHKISEEVCKQLMANFPGAEVIVHQDPAGLGEKVEYRDQL